MKEDNISQLGDYDVPFCEQQYTHGSCYISLFKFNSFDQFITPQTASNFRHLLSCGTIVVAQGSARFRTENIYSNFRRPCWMRADGRSALASVSKWNSGKVNYVSKHCCQGNTPQSSIAAQNPDTATCPNVKHFKHA